MYEKRQISLQSFRENNTFAFIEDKEIILTLVNELLDTPFVELCQQAQIRKLWNLPDVSPDVFADDLYREKGILRSQHIFLPESSITCGEELALFARYMQREGCTKDTYAKDPCPDEIVNLHLNLFAGFVNNSN